MSAPKPPFAQVAPPAPAWQDDPKTIVIGWSAMTSPAFGDSVPLLKFAHVAEQSGHNVIVAADLSYKLNPHMKREIEDSLYIMSHVYKLDLRGLRIEYKKHLAENLTAEGVYKAHLVIDTEESFPADGGYVDSDLLGRVARDGSIESLPFLAKNLGIGAAFQALLQSSNNRSDHQQFGHP